MKSSKLLTTAAAALTVVGAGLVYAQTTPAGPGNTPTDQSTNQAAQPSTSTPGVTPMQNSPTPPTSPSQDTMQRSTTPMAPDAQADRN